ncbi:MAG: hypothetical protein II825_10715 [Paludibacteraceae bacterium]|nr:hypothetical protein [Paludibacteraceae bacterium]
MRKILLLFAAIVSLNMIMPQKASAQEVLPNVWRGDICYFLEDAQFGAFAIVSAFSLQLTGHVIVPDTVEYPHWGDHPTMWPVIGVGSRILYNRSITSLDLPATIDNVKDDTFSESETLNSLIIRAEVPPVVYDKDFNEVSDTDIFNKHVLDIKVYVPDGSVQAYKDDSNWGKRPIFPISQYQAIDNVQSGKVQSTKVIKDGVLLIERNGKTYNAQGAEVR